VHPACSCATPLPPPVSSPPPYNPVYVSPSTGITYVYNFTRATWPDADRVCRAARGYLVTYPSSARQAEVETIFRQRFVLRGDTEPFYWLGLNVRNFDFWPNFTWSQGLRLAPGVYSHWGEFRPGQHLEPNNAFPPEDCAGANHSQSYSGTWGWSDAHCKLKFPFMCEIPVPTPPPSSPAPPDQLLGYTNTGRNSVVRGARFVYNSTQMDYLAAQKVCQGGGGNLVVGSSRIEQNEVEQAFINRGAILRHVLDWLPGDQHMAQLCACHWRQARIPALGQEPARLKDRHGAVGWRHPLASLPERLGLERRALRLQGALRMPPCSIQPATAATTTLTTTAATSIHT
jgi:hypothetical protein